MVLLPPTVAQFPWEKLVGLKNRRAAIIILQIECCFLFVFISFWIFIIVFSRMEAFRDFQSSNTMSYFCNWHHRVQERRVDFKQQAHVIDCQRAVSKHASSDENLALQTLSIPVLRGIHWSFGSEMKFLSSFDQSFVKSRCFQWFIPNDAKMVWGWVVFFSPWAVNFTSSNVCK